MAGKITRDALDDHTGQNNREFTLLTLFPSIDLPRLSEGSVHMDIHVQKKNQPTNQPNKKGLPAENTFELTVSLLHGGDRDGGPALHKLGECSAPKPHSTVARPTP